MKEFCLNNEVWNETEMKNLVKDCENIILGWENHCKNHGYDKTDAFYNFWNYAISRIKDVKQIFELILKSNDIYIWFQGVDFNDSILTVYQASILNAHNDNRFEHQVCLLYIWELLCRHFSEKPCPDNDDANFVIFPYYKTNTRIEWDVQGIMNECEQLKKEGKL